jgi:hypothetical protein
MWKQSKDNKETKYQQNYSLQNEIMRKTAAYAKWDHKRNDILDKLKTKSKVIILNYQKKWNM